MLVKILMFFVFLWFFAVLAVWLVGIQIKKLFQPKKPLNQKDSKQNHTHGSSKLVKCQQCGTYIPADQAIQVKDCYYCNQSCKPEP